MANREQLEELAKTISNSIKESIQSAFKSIVVPANAGTLVQDISQSFETKNMSELSIAIGKTNTLIEKVGFNLEKFGKGINNTFEKYLAQKTAAEKEVEEMKERNVLGQTELIKNEIKATTVGTEELTTRKEIIEREEKQLNLKEENLNPQELESLQKDKVYIKKREKLQKEKKSIQNTERENNTQLGEVLGNRTAGGWRRLPEFIRGPLELFTFEIMKPVRIIKELWSGVKYFGDQIKQTGEFLVGNFLHGLKMVRKGFRKLRRRMRGFIGKGLRLLSLAFLAIGPIIMGVGGIFTSIISLGGLLIRRFPLLIAATTGLGLAFKGLKSSMPSLGETMVRFLLGEEGVASMKGKKLTVKSADKFQPQDKEMFTSDAEIKKEQLEKKIKEQEKFLDLPNEEKDIIAKALKGLSKMTTKTELEINKKQLEFYNKALNESLVIQSKAVPKDVEKQKTTARAEKITPSGALVANVVAPIIDASNSSTNLNKVDNAVLVAANVDNTNSMWAVPDFIKGDYV